MMRNQRSPERQKDLTRLPMIMAILFALMSLSGAALTAMAGAAPASPPPGFPLRGEVLDFQTGKPIPGVRPVLDDDPAHHRANLDPQSRWGFDHVSPGRHKLTFLKDDPALTSHVIECTYNKGLSLDLWVSQPIENLRLQLQRRPVQHGRVEDEQGHPIAGARITWDLEPNPRQPPYPDLAVTDAQGRFHFSSLTLPPRTLFAGAPGHFSCQVELAPRDYGEPPVEHVIKLACLDRGRTVSGRVVGAEGHPLPHFPVNLGIDWSAAPGIAYGHSTATDDKGEFRFSGVPPVKLILKTDGSYPGMQYATRRVNIPAQGSAEGIVLKSPAQTSTGAVRGRLTCEDHQPAGDELIYAHARTREDEKSGTDSPFSRSYQSATLTGPDGRFTLAGLNPETHVDLYLDDRHMPYWESPVKIAGDVQVSTSGLELTFPSSGKLNGKSKPWNPNAPVPQEKPRRLVDSVTWRDRGGNNQTYIHAAIQADCPCLAVNDRGIMTADDGMRLHAEDSKW